MTRYYNHLWPWLAFLSFTTNVFQCCKHETTRSTIKYFTVPIFLLSGKSNYVVEVFSADCQRTSQPKVRQVVGISCQFFIECTPTRYCPLKQCNLNLNWRLTLISSLLVSYQFRVLLVQFRVKVRRHWIGLISFQFLVIDGYYWANLQRQITAYTKHCPYWY